VARRLTLRRTPASNRALEHGATEIIAVSVDQTFPPDCLARFRAHGKEFVTAMTATRQPGHCWLTFDWSADGKEMEQKDPTLPLQKMAAGGMGCWWAKADIFKRMPAPWFYTTLNEIGTDVVRTSDFNFFHDCKLHGVDVWVRRDDGQRPHVRDPVERAVLGRSVAAPRDGQMIPKE
jgi:hypothetical protein